MGRIIDGILDTLYPREPGQPDRNPLWLKLLVLGMLAAVFLFMAFARQLDAL